MAICALTITSLLSVLAVHIYKNKRTHTKFNKSYLPEVIDHLEGKPSAVYEELCRQRMSGQDASIAVKIGGGRKTSKQSSTSSWPDESLLQSSNLDISTGHVLLEFLREHLDKPGEISNQWKSLADYVNRFWAARCGQRGSEQGEELRLEHSPLRRLGSDTAGAIVKWRRLALY